MTLSPPQLSSGVPGIEGQHTLTPPSPWGAVTLNANDPMDAGSTWGPGSPFTRLDKITGIHDKPDSDDPRVNLVYQAGELPLPRYQRGRTITYSGSVYGYTLDDMRNLAAQLRAVTANGSTNNAITNPLAWLVKAQYASAYDTNGLVFAAYGIPLGFTCDDGGFVGDSLPTPYQAPFDLTFRQSDGRWWVTSAPASAGWDGDTYTGIASGTSGTLDMDGTAPSEPTFTLESGGDGSATLTFTAEELGAQLQIVLPAAMSSGDKLVVNFGQRTITYTPSGDPAEDYTGYLDWANTNWWDEQSAAWSAPAGGSLLLGTNTLTVTGDNWAVKALPACW